MATRGAWICDQLSRRGIGERVPRVCAGVACVEGETSEAFLGTLRGALARELPAAFFASDWSASLRGDFERLLEGLAACLESGAYGPDGGPWFLIPTGGTSGVGRFAVHTEESLRAAARAYVSRFGEAAAASWSVLPLYHVGGFMTLMRALEADAPWEEGDYRAVLEGEIPPELRGALSLVPTQLHRLLDSPAAVDRLRACARIFVGGAALGVEDRERARRARLPLAPCYGMTETAAMVTALDPEAFLAGRTGCGEPLPHASISFAPGEGMVARPGRVLLEASSLARGLWPGEAFPAGPLATSDEGYRDEAGSLHLWGRLDGVIVSGGEKVDPGRIEQVFRRFAPGAEVRVVGIPDADWGQRVIAFVAGEGSTYLRDEAPWRDLLRPAERPKAVIRLQALPRTAVGKVDAHTLRAVGALVRGDGAAPPRGRIR
jgi:o-succinylbenzoate---CoA ligase